MSSEKEKTLHEIFTWCMQESNKQDDLYLMTYGDDHVRADAMGDAYCKVACYCLSKMDI